MHNLPPCGLGFVVTLTILHVSPAARTKVQELSGFSAREHASQLPGATIRRREAVRVVQPARWRHAYGLEGAAPLCSASAWDELAPAGEVTCPECRRMQNEPSRLPAWRRTVLLSL